MGTSTSLDLTHPNTDDVDPKLLHSPGTDWEALSSTDGSDDCDLSCQNGGLCLPQVKLLMFVHESFSKVS